MCNFNELNKLKRTQTSSNRIDNKTEYLYTEKVSKPVHDNAVLPIKDTDAPSNLR